MTSTPAAPAPTGLALADFNVPAPTSTPAPLLPLITGEGDAQKPATLRVSDSLTLGVCKREGSNGEPVLARLKPAKAETATEPATEDAWRPTSRISDIARAIAGGLLT